MSLFFSGTHKCKVNALGLVLVPLRFRKPLRDELFLLKRNPNEYEFILDINTLKPQDFANLTLHKLYQNGCIKIGQIDKTVQFKGQGRTFYITTNI